MGTKRVDWEQYCVVIVQTECSGERILLGFLVEHAAKVIVTSEAFEPVTQAPGTAADPQPQTFRFGSTTFTLLNLEQLLAFSTSPKPWGKACAAVTLDAVQPPAMVNRVEKTIKDEESRRLRKGNLFGLPNHSRLTPFVGESWGGVGDVGGEIIPHLIVPHRGGGEKRQ
jgi:hypothetical protein